MFCQVKAALVVCSLAQIENCSLCFGIKSRSDQTKKKKKKRSCLANNPDGETRGQSISRVQKRVALHAWPPLRRAVRAVVWHAVVGWNVSINAFVTTVPRCAPLAWPSTSYSTLATHGPHRSTLHTARLLRLLPLPSPRISPQSVASFGCSRPSSTAHAVTDPSSLDISLHGLIDSCCPDATPLQDCQAPQPPPHPQDAHGDRGTGQRALCRAHSG